MFCFFLCCVVFCVLCFVFRACSCLCFVADVRQGSCACASCLRVMVSVFCVCRVRACALWCADVRQASRREVARSLALLRCCTGHFLWTSVRVFVLFTAGNCCGRPEGKRSRCCVASRSGSRCAFCRSDVAMSARPWSKRWSRWTRSTCSHSRSRAPPRAVETLHHRLVP